MIVGDIIIERDKDVQDSLQRTKGLQILMMTSNKVITCHHYHAMSELKAYNLDFLESHYKVVTAQVEEIENQ